MSIVDFFLRRNPDDDLRALLVEELMLGLEDDAVYMPACMSDLERAGIETKRRKIDREEAELLAGIAYHEKQIDAARKQLADLALCRDANDAAAAVLNASRAIKRRRAMEEDYDLDAEVSPPLPAHAEVEKAA